MCGIIGYLGNKQACAMLMEALDKLQYRGYDSSGIALLNSSNKLVCHKKAGKLDNLIEEIGSVYANNSTSLESSCGIGHTRWATHGAPSDSNAHPQLSNSGKIALVHNGIIENYLSLKSYLANEGFSFTSDTDSEVLTNLIEHFYDDDLSFALHNALKMVKGSYAIALVCADKSDTIWVAKNDMPLVIGQTENETIVASDIPTLSTMCRRCVVLGNGEMAELTRDRIRLYDVNYKTIAVNSIAISDCNEEITKGSFDTFMRKEIAEIPLAVKNTFIQLSNFVFDEYVASDIDNIVLVGCGTAFHACSVASQLIVKYLKINATAVIASEYLYSSPIINKYTLVVAVSQSGETADTLNVIKLAKSRNAYVVAITNVLNSSITFLADCLLHTKAGIEIGVASTKAYSAQLIALICFINSLARSLINRNVIDIDINAVSNMLIQLTTDYTAVSQLAETVEKEDKIFFIGRMCDYVSACEASLKLKEISYINCQAVASGELKHGTLALINEQSKVIVFATDKSLLPKTMSNMNEVKARGAYIIAISPFEEMNELADAVIKLPEVSAALSAVTSIVPMQQLSLLVALKFGNNPDKPRNLAKSVTVE